MMDPSEIHQIRLALSRGENPALEARLLDHIDALQRQIEADADRWQGEAAAHRARAEAAETELRIERARRA